MTEQEINNLIDSKIGKVKMSQLPETDKTGGLYSIGYIGNQSVKYKANLLQGDPLTVRKTYQTEAEALADKNPIDTTTSLPLKVGQFVSIVDDGEKNGIYRISSISGDGTMSLELQGKLGDLSGYTKTGGSTKTTKEVENDLVQLEAEQNKKTDGAWAINKDDWASVADAVIDVRVEPNTTIKDILIENVRTDGENILLTVRYLYWNGLEFLSSSHPLVHELGGDNINTAEWSTISIKSIKVTYIKSRLKTAQNWTKVQVKDANIVSTPIPRIVQSVGNLISSVKNDVILKVESSTSHLPETFVITRLRNSESQYFYVSAEIDGVQYTYSGRAELYTGITPVPLSSFIVYVNADSIVGNNNPLAIEINPLEIQQSIGAVTDEIAQLAVDVEQRVNLDSLDSLGLEQVLGYNFIEHLYGISREDTEVWGNGLLRDSGNVSIIDDWLHTRDYIPVYKGTYDVNIFVRGNACLLIYNNKKEVVKAETYISTNDGTQGRSITIEENGFIRFSYPAYIDEGGAYIPLEGRHFTNTSAVILSDNSVFLKTNEAEELITDTVNTNLSYYGITPTLPGNNFISELTGSSVLDTSLWGNGFLTSEGGISIQANWYHSKKYYRLPRGSYQMYFYASGNAKILVYDENKENIVRVLAFSVFDGKQYNETFDQDVYLRISHREGENYDGSTDNIYVVNTTNIYGEITGAINIDNRVMVGSDEAVASGAIPTFMRDIYKKMNPPRLKRPIVTFICDDGHINDKNWYIPLLDEYNVKTTLAISKHWVVEADNGGTNRLNSEDIINYHKDGHDIANHTTNHLYLDQITLEEADNEIAGNNVFLQDLINDDIPMFVSPFGVRNANLDEVIARYHKANFISGWGVRNETPIDSYFINRVSFDTLEDNVLLWESRLLPALDSCLENSEWLVFAIHSGYLPYSSRNPVYMERRNELRLIIEWCNTNGVQIMTAKNAYNYWRNPVEIGVKRKDENYYRLGMDGTEEGEGILM